MKLYHVPYKDGHTRLILVTFIHTDFTQMATAPCLPVAITTKHLKWLNFVFLVIFHVSHCEDPQTTRKILTEIYLKSF